MSVFVVKYGLEFCSIAAMKRRSVKTLPSKMYGELYRLSTTAKLFGLRHSDTIIMNDLQRIIRESSVKDDFAGWTERKLSKWFFDHFFRPVPRRPSAKARREELFRASERARILETALLQRQAEYLQESFKQSFMETSLGVTRSLTPRIPNVAEAGESVMETVMKCLGGSSGCVKLEAPAEPPVIRAEDVRAMTGGPRIPDTPTLIEVEGAAEALVDNTTGVKSGSADPKVRDKPPGVQANDVQGEGNRERTTT